MSKKRTELDLQQFLPYRVNRLSDRVSGSLSRIYAERFGISVPEWRVLTWLNQCEVLTAKDICRLAPMDKATVSRAVQRLAKRGLLQREPAPNDQRVQLLTLTAAAHELLSELLPRAHDWEAQLLTSFSAQEYRDLLNLLGKLERQLDRMQEQAAEQA